jgi:dTDP-4-dehydrorhamnose 3,5-epimerase
MKINIKGIKIFKSKIFYDKRGSFKEVYKKKLLPNKELIFHCVSSSKKNVLRGLHLQTKNSQAKFLTVIKGKIFDVL